MEFLTKSYIMAFWFGAFSALSLPLGAVIGILLRPAERATAAIMAFGAGSLLAALVFELVAPAMKHTGFAPLALGCLLGCIVFVVFNQMLNSNGAFLRKSSTMIAHMKTAKRKRVKEMIEKLSKVDILRSLPPEDVQEIIPYVEDRFFRKGTMIFSQDKHGDALYLIENGQVRIERATGIGKKEIAVLGPGETFGEMALLWHAPRSATAVAETDVKTWEIHVEDFDDLIEASPRLKKAVTELAEYRRKNDKFPLVTTSIEKWRKRAMNYVSEENYRPTAIEIKQASGKHAGGAAFAIWLGIFLDGIPESLTIGASMIKTAISPALIGGLFLANLPESMSSAVLMKNQGTKSSKIYWMWISLMIMTGAGALIGNICFEALPLHYHSIFGGLAAGSMLAMIAQTMLPEAYEHGGWLVGIMTVLGFLVALFLHSLQQVAH